MMTRAYSELYIDDAMETLGEMLDYAVNDLKLNGEDFFSWFIVSGIAESFEHGNPKYVAGMSGFEIAQEILFRIKGEVCAIKPTQSDALSAEYWTGWIMTYYQWYRDISFSKMIENGLTVSKVLSMYILHEADEAKFVDAADRIIAKEKALRPSNLSLIRKNRGMTQKELSDASGVSLRMIQLYEQRQNDISAAQFSAVNRLAKVLGCNIDALIE